jgi:glutaredoxin-related protein
MSCNNLQNKINDKEWLIFGLNTCKYTIKSLKLLKKIYNKKFNEKVEYINIKNFMGKEKFKDCMAEMTGNYRTFPMIYNRNEFIGGFDKLNNLLQ